MEIQPCPFCGSKAELGHVALPGKPEDLRMRVSCTGDGCWATITEWIGDGRSVQRVIESWNRNDGMLARVKP